jgi:DNA-binding NarL/FixJ family response regulator
MVASMAIRTVIAEDNLLVREGVRRLLDLQTDIEIVATCGDLDALLAAVERERPDVIVTDIRMPPSGLDEGLQAADALRDLHPDIGVIVLSQYAEPEYALRLFNRGSDGRAYLLKERLEDVDQLRAAIHAVAGGGSMVDPLIIDALVSGRLGGRSSPIDDLTPREGDVLREMAEGKNNAAIASTLYLTEHSVEKVIHSIFSKLGLAWAESTHKRVKAVLLYLADQQTGSSP